MGGKEHRQPAAVKPQAEIDVVVHYAMRLVEAVHRLEDRAPHHHAGAGDAKQVALAKREAEIAGVIGGGEAEGMAGAAGHGAGQEHAGMLYLAIGIKQLRAHHADLGPFGLGHQHAQPVGGQHLDVVIEEQQVIAAGCGRAQIVQP